MLDKNRCSFKNSRISEKSDRCSLPWSLLEFGVKGMNAVSKGIMDFMGTSLEIIKLIKHIPKCENKFGNWFLTRNLILLLTNASKRCKLSDLVELNSHKEEEECHQKIAKIVKCSVARQTIRHKGFKITSDDLESFLFNLWDGGLENEKGTN